MRFLLDLIIFFCLIIPCYAQYGTGPFGDGSSANAISKDGTTTTTSYIPFAHGIDVSFDGTEGGGYRDAGININTPLGATIFTIRMQGYYTDGIRFDGELKTTDVSISNLFALNDSSIWSPTTTNKTVWSIGAVPLIYGSNNADNLYGFLSSPYSRPSIAPYSAALTNIFGYSSQITWGSGTVTNLYNYHVKSPSISGTVTNAYGLYVENITGASNNYAIYTNSGLVRFGDDVQMTGKVTSSRTSDLGWTVQTAANQACTTTCTSAAVFGQDTATGNIVGPSDATADRCVCAGAS